MGWFHDQLIRSKYPKATEEEREQMRREYPDALAPVLRLEAKQAQIDARRGAQKKRKTMRKELRHG